MRRATLVDKLEWLKRELSRKAAGLPSDRRALQERIARKEQAIASFDANQRGD